MKLFPLRSALILGAFALILVPGSASAATKIGQTAPAGAMLLACAPNTGLTQGNNTPDVSYSTTSTGVITEWRVQAGNGTGTLAVQSLTRDTVNPDQFAPTAESALETLVQNTLNTYKTRIPIAAGQYIGLRVGTANNDCAFSAPTGNTAFGSLPPAPAVGGGPVAYGNGQAMERVNLAVTIEPDADNDGFGDETQDGCPKNAQRSDDCVKPSVAIDKGPKKKTSRPKAKFKFSSDDPKATFECSVDGKKFSACTSPLKLKKLKKGRHVFEVRASDQNDNTSTADPYKWKVQKKKVKS